MEVFAVKVLYNTPGTDNVYLVTDLPSGMPEVSQDNVVLQFSVQHGKGIEYARTHFPDLEITAIDAKTGNLTKYSSG